MFGFGRKKDNVIDVEKICNYYKERTSEQIKKNTGEADYSFFNEYPAYENNANVIDIQETVISNLIYYGIQNVICDYKMNDIFLVYKELKTVPLFEKMRTKYEGLDDAVFKFEDIRKRSVLDEKIDIKSQLDLMEEEIDKIQSAGEIVQNEFTGVLLQQDYAGGKSLAEKSVEEVMSELCNFMFYNISYEELFNAKKKLMAYSLFYDQLENETVMENQDGEKMHNDYDFYYESPYRILFETKGVISEDVLISDMIVESTNDVDKNTVNKLKSYIEQEKTESSFKSSMKKLNDLALLYNRDDIKQIVRLYL